METFHLLDVETGHLALVQAGLAALSAELGDEHRIDKDALHAALFAPQPACHGVLALGAARDLQAVALFSPVVSTTAGSAGAYVSDLWVAHKMRGSGLGKALLRHIAARARTLWQARFIRLVNYAPNARAHAFYSRLGFVENDGERVLQLSGDAFERFKG